MSSLATPSVTRVPESEARRWSIGIFVEAGMRPDDAATVADNLVASDCRGLFSHGLMRTRAYVKRLQTGCTDPLATPAVVERSDGTSIVDGRNAMGQVVGTFAVEQAITQARQHGVGVIGVRGSNHFGTCEYYAMKASAAHMIGIVATVSSHNIMAPFGGAEGLIGNNPIGIAIPTRHAPPLVLDFAMSVAAGGKIRLAAETGESIPQDWALDLTGSPTTDPLVALEGTVQPLAGYKGYGLAFMVAMLCAVLPGAAFGRDVTDLYRDFTRAQNVGHFVQAIDVGRFGDVEAFEARVDAAIELMHSAKRSTGVDRILVPGEREHLIAQEQRAYGIAYPQAIVDDLNALAGELGTPILVELPGAKISGNPESLGGPQS
jgi:LDH2 family malate/lactate/ureidoglycolate dehydrogenase